VKGRGRRESFVGGGETFVRSFSFTPKRKGEREREREKKGR
jgi:hypothetical protein